MKIENNLDKKASVDNVTIVIVHDIRKDKHDLYEKIIESLITLLQQQSGFLSIDVIRPIQGSLRYVAIMRFDHEKNAAHWLNLPERKDLLLPIQPWLLAGDNHQIQTNPDFWFRPEKSSTAPKAWKRFVSSWIAVLPLAMTIPAFYLWFFKNVLNWSILWIGIPISLTISWFMTYLTMPYITKVLGNWLSK